MATKTLPSQFKLPSGIHKYYLPEFVVELVALTSWDAVSQNLVTISFLLWLPGETHDERNRIQLLNNLILELNLVVWLFSCSGGLENQF